MMEENQMSNEFQDMSTAPTLTLDPFQTQEEKKTPVVAGRTALDDSILTEEDEKDRRWRFAQQIDLTNSAMVLQYGAGTQKKMADFLRVSTGKPYVPRIWARWESFSLVL